MNRRKIIHDIPVATDHVSAESYKVDEKLKSKYHHIGIPTNKPIKGEVYLKKYKVYYCGYDKSEYGIEWMRYEKDCPLPAIVKTVPHVAFEVENIHEAIKGKKVIIEPNSPSEGIIVAFIEENGAPIEFIQMKEKKGNDAQVNKTNLS